jgi:hypothetical protein
VLALFAHARAGELRAAAHHNADGIAAGVRVDAAEGELGHGSWRLDLVALLSARPGYNMQERAGARFESALDAISSRFTARSKEH